MMVFKNFLGRFLTRVAPEIPPIPQSQETPRQEPPKKPGFEWETVGILGGSVTAVAPDGRQRKILDADGKPIRRFRPGWAARGALSFRSGAAIVDLVHADGRTEAWIIDQSGRRITDRPWERSDSGERISAEAIRAFFARDVLTVVDHFLEAPKEALRVPAVRRLMALSQQNLVELIRAAGVLELHEVDSYDEAIARIMTIDWDVGVRYMFAEGRVVVPALTHEGDARRAVVIRCGRLDYVVHAMDNDDGPAWMAAITMGKTQRNTFIQWLLLPDRRSFVRGRKTDSDSTTSYDSVASHVAMAVSMYAGASAGPSAAILPLFEDPARIALEFRPANHSHLGHLVWNHLSGIHRLVETCRDNGQELVVYDASVRPGAHVYGNLEQIFPELEGKVINSDPGRANDLELFTSAARRGHSLIGYRIAEVPVSLRERLQRSTSLEVTARAVEPLIDFRIRAADGKRPPVLALGLRLQNRAVSNLLDLYTKIVRRLAEVVSPDPLFVLIDGMNVLPNGNFAAGAEAMAANEKAFVNALREEVTGSGAEIISCVGMTIAENLAWLRRADMFVAPQGGGLTKLRWIHHKPGYVLTSATNLRLSKRTFLYGDGGGTESPLPMLVNAIKDVEDFMPRVSDDEDRPGSSLGGLEDTLSSKSDRPGLWTGGLSSVNFRVVGRKAVVASIEELFRQTLASRSDERLSAN